MIETKRGRKMQLSRKDVHSRKRRKKKHSFIKWFFISLLVIFLALLGIGAYTLGRFNKSFERVYDKTIEEQVVEVRDTKEQVTIGKDPFSILVLGIDTGEFDRTEVGRSDIMMVATINPNTNQTVMTSIPRDTYTEIIGQGTHDKINHAYAFGGISMSINTVQNLLDIPIDYYIKVDMGGFTHIVDTLGGISITPTETFDQEGTYFEEGVTQLMDGKTILQYVRNRYTDGGDYSRQQRSRQVIEALAQNVLNINLVANLPEYMEIFENYVQTNIKFTDVQKLGLSINSIGKNIEELSLTGNGETIDGVYYERLDEASLANVQTKLKANLEL